MPALKIFTTIILITFFSFKSFADTSQKTLNVKIVSDSINSNESRILFGYINDNLATNFNENGEYLDIYWISENNEVLSKKAYLFEDNHNTDKVKFCAKSLNDIYCSNFEYITRSHITNTSTENKSELIVNFNNPEDIVTGDKPISFALFNIEEGFSSFIYQEHLDQDGRVLSNSISYDTISSVLIGVPLSKNTTEIKACAIGGFIHSEPTYISECSDTYIIDDINDSNKDLLCLFEHVNMKGEKLCFKEKDLNKVINLPLEFDNIVSSLLISNGYRVTLSSDFTPFTHKTWAKTYNRNTNYVGKHHNDRYSSILLEKDDTAVCFWEHAYFLGRNFCVPKNVVEAGITLPSYFQYITSSMTISPNYKILSYKGDSGKHYLRKYYYTYLFDKHKNDKIKSYKVMYR
ncbi:MULTISPECIES: hypothetical protein [Aliivibrio]|uniref:Uncharacterized protein n=1 Tax=Aliivibrio finisterrensis TaxID=511998 RepID=A0A4Q5KWC0_9GAMM|nr:MULTISPECIES: hypothetical protein [Aliivibrio]MDD9177763.1 hypothetical protein [Aliivibrio sp. A6]RYU50272.1 hypothetical protein ERW56_15110 [Aliivibrio finisterrensis]RYU51887.1 hypothetical protein ERW57_08215 [Aliivibrio finisterrensis]RYU55999.1 hypothetical protein ERW50_15165 [Aliivibrio finisterrensis]RYU64716.1 hypothetical protein ERW53_08940 [Aliivibrio finisterrensis]